MPRFRASAKTTSSEPRLLSRRKLDAQGRDEPYRLIVRFDAATRPRLLALQQSGVQLAPWIRRLVSAGLDANEREGRQ